MSNWTIQVIAMRDYEYKDNSTTSTDTVAIIRINEGTRYHDIDLTYDDIEDLCFKLREV